MLICLFVTGLVMSDVVPIQESVLKTLAQTEVYVSEGRVTTLAVVHQVMKE